MWLFNDEVLLRDTLAQGSGWQRCLDGQYEHGCMVTSCGGMTNMEVRSLMGQVVCVPNTALTVIRWFGSNLLTLCLCALIIALGVLYGRTVIVSHRTKHRGVPLGGEGTSLVNEVTPDVLT
ncbi:hypothetical protein KIPB_005817 [Kipferlia bialata]|nr:hypothetical protein KIPB_005817 [Kipferlia bialata]|eukprot:g5817.t1